MAEDDGWEKLVCHKEIKGELTKSTYNNGVVRQGKAYRELKLAPNCKTPNEQEISMKMPA